MGKYFDKIESFVKKSFAGQDGQIKHFDRTVYWIKQLYPQADEAMLIAAMSHDIERAYRTREQLQTKDKVGFTNPAFFRPHEEKGAEIIAAFLKKEGADAKMIERVKMLISRHEEGGNDDQNLLKDADSVSFFENNVYIFFAKLKEDGKKKVKDKFDWMFNRISSPKAKKIAKVWYDHSIKDLEKMKI